MMRAPLRYLLRALIGLLVLLLLATAGLTIYLRTESFNQLLVREVNGALQGRFRGQISIGAIRTALDAAGLERTILMSYAVKFHSTLYGPFRVAADSAPKSGSALGDRASYQLDPARPGDAWLCAERDAEQGADILMVKPGLPYLDLLRELSRAIRKPWAVYHVSGEFAALEALAASGLANRAALHREILTAFRHAGASMIITYGARYARDWLRA